MRALAASGRDNEALLVYQRTSEALADALGVDPSPELSALHVALLRGEVRRRAEDRKTNLRAELTSFIGKDEAVAAVGALVAEHRLTTLIGPGGSGKTRLATETARRMLDDLPDGVWLVEFAAIGADGDVAQATLAGLGLRDALLGEPRSMELTDRLVAAIREREALLILDNCEHVIESAAVLAHRLLGECRRLRILATSREPLGITGEALWPVAPLALPDVNADASEIEASPAVRLLRDRAVAVRRDLAVDASMLSTMARICRALDGMPLAIELAAARLRTMSIDQLATRLDDRFRLLTGGSRTALPRHRTLRAVVDWSWELLTDAERTVLRRLSVFSGGASLEAAERVCAGDEVEPEDVLELLTALTEKSLLVAEGDEAPRYRMLGTIKEYAVHRLAEAGESDLARHAHLAYFTELAETAEPQLRRADQLRWLDILEVEHDNIGAAMRGALAAGEAHAAMRLAAGAGWYWWLGGHKTEGMELIMAATETPGEVSDEIRAMVYALVVLFITRGLATSTRRPSGSTRRTSSASAVREPPGDGTRRPAGTDVAGAGRDPARMGTAAGRRGPLGTRAGPAAPRQDADHSRPGRPGCGRVSEAALAEFRALGERFGISFALTELAELIAVRGELRRRVRALRTGDQRSSPRSAPSRTSSGCGRGRPSCTGCVGDEKSSAAAMAEAQRMRGTGHLAGCAGRAGAVEGGARSLERLTPSRRAGSSASRRPCWATRRSWRRSAR